MEEDIMSQRTMYRKSAMHKNYSIMDIQNSVVGNGSLIRPFTCAN